MSGRILIIDQVATNRIVMKVRLSAAHFHVDLASCAQDAVQKLKTTRPDMILMSLGVGEDSAPDLCVQLRQRQDTQDTPILVLGDTITEAERMACLHAGAQDVLSRGLPEHQLLAHVRRTLRASASDFELRLRETTNRALGFAEDTAGFVSRPNIWVVMEGSTSTDDWCASLRSSKSLAVQCHDFHAADWTDLIKSDADVFVVPIQRGGAATDLSIITELRSARSTRHIPIVAMLDRDNTAQISMALDLGADELVYHDTSPRELTLRITRQAERKHVAERLRSRVRDGLQAAVTDPLTGLFNRRYAMPHLDQMSAAAQKSGRAYAVMMIDLDRFKLVNDTYGHPAGDAVLVEVAKRLQDNLRGVDLIARMGGEEFLIAMPATSLHQAKAAAQRLRKVVWNTPIRVPSPTPHEPDLRINVSISLGLAMGGGAQSAVDDISHVLQLADNALIRAKADGRNQVMVSRDAA
ncbi:diguanylate cyclase [Nereida sp. MMG025]|uniref:diguanylate cyclase n=1 Tax=Nereida sp. MMG025 TaxID=2909981 RepID=UPI001F02EA75|nr:diguanylate cyclase [Nereida sp. MMG025]MCF6445109.1 diguanylate cyclase [Nereida sp. MMG025]